MKQVNQKKAARQFITNENGEKVSVIIPISEYLKLLEELEENEDIRLYDEVKARKERRILLDDYLKARRKKQDA